MSEAMVARLLVLVVAASLLGAVPACTCEGHGIPKVREAACGHCPEDPAPQKSDCPSSDCCCVHESTDRATEQPASIQHPAIEIDQAPAFGTQSSKDHSFGVVRPAGAAERRSGPLLHLLFRHLAI